MNKESHAKRITWVLGISLVIVFLFNGCNFPQSGTSIEVPEVPAQESDSGKGEVDAVPLVEPLVIPDYSKYSAVTDMEYYQNKYLGEIFIIKEWQTSSPQVNTLSVYGKITFTVHPDQSLDALEFKNPDQPVILTGFGRGWGKIVVRGEGHGSVSGQSADIYMVCTGEVNAEFKMVGGFYPAPTCTLDVDIVTTYFPEESVVTCVYNDQLTVPYPMETYIDMFTDVKLPITFRIPEDYVTRFTSSENNIKYDLSYYLYNFWGSSPSEAELALVFGDQPVQFYETGCQSVHIAFDTGFLPEGSELLDAPPSAWDIMLTPESMREQP